MRVLLVSTYELGHQPLHVASPAGVLSRGGHEVRCADVSVEPLDPHDVNWAEAIALSVPMHTAMRIAARLCEQIRSSRQDVPMCVYGLYAQTADFSSDRLDVEIAIAGEYEERLVRWVEDLQRRTGRAVVTRRTVVELGRGRFGLPARHLLPSLDRYAQLSLSGTRRLAGYVEASHGCAHRCRHCPVPVVYDGRTRLVGVEPVMADVEQLVELGARHISFGDPDFLNGPHHALRVVSAFHDAFEGVTFDVTAKVEHVLSHRELWPRFADAGCLFVVCAFESTSPEVLLHLQKGHSAEEEAESVLVLRAAGIEPRPSFVPFTPWTKAGDLFDLLDLVARCDLVGNVDPIQFAIRLLVPPGSLLLRSGALEGVLERYDEERLSWTWRSDDPRLDRLASDLGLLAERAAREDWGAEQAYEAVREEVDVALGDGSPRPRPMVDRGLESLMAQDDRPRLTEAWFCCAEPTATQLEGALLEPAGACASEP